MKYKVLYRKYRPDNFENIIGQEFIITTLKNSILNNNISHAYIFSGPRGTGKTTTAKVFAKAINCLNPENGSPCGKCDFCVNFKENPDIIEIDAASNNGVNEIRNIIDNIKLAPTNGKYKVYIIDEFHMLTKEAFNAFLLTLEEPPSHVIFILATTNIENVPITILSRCQRFDFKKIKIEDIVKSLRNISDKENINIDDDALNEIAYLSEGGMRDALSLLDQLSKNGKQITSELIENEIKIVSQKSVTELTNYIENNDVESFLKLIDDFRQRGVDYKTLVKKIIDIASNRAKKIKTLGSKKRLTFEDYREMIFKLTDSFNKININVDSYTILELILLDFFENPISSVKENKDIKVKETTKNEELEPSKEENNNILNDNLIEIRINNCFVNAQKKFLENVRKDLENCTQNTNIDGKLKSIIIDSKLVAASDKNLIFICNNEHNVESANKILPKIEKYLNSEMKSDYKMIYISESRWQIEKEKYINNIKNKKVYQYIEEENEINNEDIEINNVFDISKVEIV